MNGGMAVLVVHRRVSPELAYLPWAGRCNLFVHVWSAGGRRVAGRNQGDIRDTVGLDMIGGSGLYPVAN